VKRLGVIMAGGSGERFWPVSRRERPKQLLALTDSGSTMLEEAVSRLQAITSKDDIWIAAAPHLRTPIQESLVNFPEQNILAEPHKRNTSGCLIWVAANLLARDPDARETTSMAVVTADHRIVPTSEFARTTRAALEVAEQTGGLVTIGISPTRAETGFGYIELSDETIANTEKIEMRRVARFREKPKAAEAEAYVSSGRFLWNSGMFFWSMDGFLRELEGANQEMAAAIPMIAEDLRSGNIMGAERHFEALPSISIDYALMEKAKQVYVARAAFEWDDLGSWDALERSFTTDDRGNVVQGEAVIVDSSNCVVYGSNGEVATCLLGVEGLVVVVTPDAVLVCPKDRAQDVRKIVDELKSRELGRT
jgi:mannose-1-phosphate guanylyltransferase